MEKQTPIQQILHGMQSSVFPSDYWLISDINFPELRAAQLIIQRDGQSVREHTMLVMDLLSIKNPITLLSGLFHDLGKDCVPSTSDNDDPSLPKFHGHAIVSANIAETRLKGWQASPYLIDRVTRIVSTHMYDVSNATQDKTIRKFIASIGQDNVNNWFTLRIADSRSYAVKRKYHSRIIESFKKVVMLYLKQQPGTDQLGFENLSTAGIIQIKGKDIL